MLRREVHGERLFLSNNKSILFTSMVKWIEIDRSGAFYRLPAPLDLLSMNGLFSGNGGWLTHHPWRRRILLYGAATIAVLHTESMA